MTKKEIFTNPFILLAPLIIALGVWGVFQIKYEKLAKRSLATQQDMSKSFLWRDMDCKFERGEYKNTATVYVGGRSVLVMKDLNKSKIAGEIAGQKSKEFFKGFFNGAKKEGKHSEN